MHSFDIFNFLVKYCVLFKHHLLIQKLCSESILLYSGHSMHLSRASRLSIISAIVASFSILSCANPTSLTFRNANSKPEIHSNSVFSSLRDPSALPQSQSNRKRVLTNSISYALWGNGWVSHSYTYVRTEMVLLSWKLSTNSPQNPERPCPGPPRRGPALHLLRPHPALRGHPPTHSLSQHSSSAKRRRRPNGAF